MKKSILFLTAVLTFNFQLLTFNCTAQLRGINYQAVAIDENGKEIPGTNISGQIIHANTIGVRFSVLSGSTTGALLYQETHIANTDQYGLFSLIIGDGGTVSGVGQYQNLIDIPWSTANQFLKVEIAIKNDGDYKLMSIQQLMAVPYAFFALNSDTASYALNAGTPGTPGATGANGAAGMVGSTGDTGAAGTNGTNGATGTTGSGATGATGNDGTNGTNGATGATGATGSDGTNGTNGAIGATGTTGSGATGSTGNNGTNGATGTNGSIGSTGATGSDGTNGTNGAIGATGTTGSGSTGSTGNNGTNGATGTNGSIGSTGATGSDGTNGTNGAIGATGTTGSGSTGSTGNNGTNGATGTNGSIGSTGATGSDGTNGTNGAIGATGKTGSGSTGATGNNGSIGSTGATGNNGTNGIAGTTGITGTNGTNGTNGINGSTGATGTNGTNGSMGATGATGTNGTNGLIGSTGATGNNGTNGIAGATGITGTNGTNGTNGINGSTGATGTNGTNGNTGATGSAGSTGSTGLLSAGTAVGNTAYWDGSQWVLSSNNIYNAGGSVGINAGASPSASAQLDITSTTKGLLPPRMTTAQMNAIVSPAKGLMIYNTDCDVYDYWNGSAWLPFPSNASAPATPGSITGSATPCQNATAVAYSIAAVSGASSYNWTVPSGSTIASGQGTASITVNFPTTNGNVCVTASNACGTSASSCTAITLSALPAQPSVITGTTPVCQGNSAVAYSITNVGGVTYTWAYSGTGYTQASGGTNNSITANFSASATSGTLSVTPSNACGNGTAQTLAITVSATPTAANAGADINPACGVSTATLSANTPTVGAGAWSVISGTAFVTSASSPTSGVTGLAVPGTATLRWTISNAPCTASTDDVVITTTSCFTCGGTLAITHTIGTVAPESKSVNYGMVTSSLSGASKCWITQNLGSTNQASSATDNTDAAAGWYWQFNRKQGYKVGPTPAWTITSISETSDWLAANDPCTIELGTGWRIPTQTEWTNADANGPWANWTDTYNSVLKLHAAGYLINTDGLLSFRGAGGTYWSSSQSSSTDGWYLVFKGVNSYMYNYGKADGYSVRCLRD